MFHAYVKSFDVMDEKFLGRELNKALVLYLKTFYPSNQIFNTCIEY